MRTCHGAGEAGLCVSRPCADCAYRRDSCTYGEGLIGEMGVEVRDLERKLIIARNVFFFLFFVFAKIDGILSAREEYRTPLS